MSHPDDQAGKQPGAGPLDPQATLPPEVPLPAAPTPAPPDRATSNLVSGETRSGGGTPAGELIGGRFEIVALLGVGGMGSVYKARDTELGELVALKMLHPDVASSAERLDRFRQEVRLARRVTHPGVARTFDIGEHGSSRFLTMEFIEGESLEAVLAREKVLDLGRTVALLVPICEGLAAAHSVGVVHRDLKPANILLGAGGRVAITDFGVAREVEAARGAGATMSPIGTPAYMAPEQVQAGQVDARSDVYALGAMLFEMLTGERPWHGDSLVAILMARMLNEPPDARAVNAAVGPTVAALVRRCMARQPGDRPAGARQVSDELQRLLQTATLPHLEALPPPAAAASLPGPAAASPVATEDGPQTTNVAVLPFRNAGQAEDEHWADGFTEDLIETLSMVPGLRIHSRGRVMSLKGSQRDPRELGRELGVTTIVEGSVRRHRGRVRVQARLVSVHDGFQVWAQRFDQPEGDLLEVTDEVAQAIASGLVKPQPAAGPGGFKDATTLELYLRARQAIHELSAEGMQRARQLFEEALGRDPDDGRLLAGHALSLTRLWLAGNFRELEVVTGTARSQAERAMERGAPAEAHLALATLHNQQLAWLEAVSEVRAALRKAPNLPDAHELRGRLLSEAGAFDDALAAFERALQCEPAALTPQLETARIHGLRRDWASCQALLERQPPRPAVTVLQIRLLLWQGEVDRARQLVEAGRSSSPYIARLNDAMFEGQVQSDGRRRQQTFFRQLHSEYLAAVGRHDEALQLIADAQGRGLTDLGWLESCPVLDPVRELPGYVSLRDPIQRNAMMVRQLLLENR